MACDVVMYNNLSILIIIQWVVINKYEVTREQKPLLRTRLKFLQQNNKELGGGKCIRLSMQRQFSLQKAAGLSSQQDSSIRTQKKQMHERELRALP